MIDRRDAIAIGAALTALLMTVLAGWPWWLMLLLPIALFAAVRLTLPGAPDKTAARASQREAEQQQFARALESLRDAARRVSRASVRGRLERICRNASTIATTESEETRIGITSFEALQYLNAISVNLETFIRLERQASVGSASAQKATEEALAGAEELFARIDDTFQNMLDGLLQNRAAAFRQQVEVMNEVLELGQRGGTA